MVYQDGEKMSKSLGNLTLVRDLLKKYEPDVIRLTLQSHHYRSPWECYPADFQNAAETIGRFKQVRSLFGKETRGEDPMLRAAFKAHMENDLNIPDAIQLLNQAAENVIANQDRDTGVEILRLTKALGLQV
jgi:cysteinyl-tRNA synthetase